MSELTEQIVEYSLTTDYEKLPDEVADCSKRIILDTLGCIVLGSTMPPGVAMRAYAKASGGNEQASVIGGGFRTSAALAALANGTSGHADELDASHKSWGHPAVSAVAGSLAMCEERNLGGRDLINAVVLAHDVGCRLLVGYGGRQAIQDERHSHSSVLNALGVSAAISRMLRFSPVETEFALALTVSNVFTLSAFMDEAEHMVKAVNHGQASYASVVGALWVTSGMRAYPRVFDAPHGLNDFWMTRHGDLEKAFADLGTRFEVSDTGFKYYSAGYPIHAPLYGSLQIMKEHDLTINELARVSVGMSTQSADIVDNRDTPSICLQDMMSVGLVRGRLSYDEAHDESLLENEDVERVRKLIDVVRDPQMDSRSARRRSAWVEIRTTDGRTIRGDEQPPPGHWERGGMPWSDVREKFASLVEPRLGAERSTRIVEAVERLETLESVAELCSALRG